MANQVPPKSLSTTHGNYRNPYRNQTDYEYYHPQLFTSHMNNYQPNKGTKEWFQDYRRSQITERTLQNNLLSLKSPLRPTNFSNKPAIALGARKIEREALFPVIHNNPVYLLSNRNPDRERYRDTAFMNNVLSHREQYMDLTGSKHKKIDAFYYPFPASEAFDKRDIDHNQITNFPCHHTAAVEFTYMKRREDPLVKHSKTDICL